MTTSDYFYHASFKKAVQIFGSRFNNIKIKRESADGVTAQTVNVPISYAPIQKELARIQADPKGARDSNIILPRMTFEIINQGRDITRVTSVNNIIKSGTHQYYMVPYILTFELNIMAKNMEDSLKIVEQIIPFFNPKLAIRAQLLENIPDTFDIPLVLNTINMQDSYDGDFITRRAVIWTLQFTMNYYLFGPVTDSKLIKFVTTNVYSDPEMQNKDLIMTLQPGLTSNSQPTANVSESIDYHLINKDDDYGFIYDTNENP